MYRLKVSHKIDSAHRLVGYKGKCSNLHGHCWKVVLTIEGLFTDKLNMLVDFGIVKKTFRKILDKELDHKDLNAVLKEKLPTAEHIAWYLFYRFKKYEKVWKCRVKKVSVAETEGNVAEFDEEI